MRQGSYRDGNKSAETRFMHAHSSKTEQAFEITMTPALYRRTIAVATIIVYMHSIHATKFVQCNDIGLVSLLIQRLAQLYYCVHYSLLNLVSGLLLPSLYLHFLIHRIFSLLVYSHFLPLHLQYLYKHACAQKSRRVSCLERMCAY